MQDVDELIEAVRLKFSALFEKAVAQGVMTAEEADRLNEVLDETAGTDEDE